MRRNLRARTLTVAVALAVLAVGHTGVAAAQQDQDCLERRLPRSKVGIQLFTYGSGGAIGADGIEAVVAHMAEVGMRNIERYGGTFGLDFDEYVDLYREHRVRPVASHGSLNLDQAEQTFAQARQMRQRYIGSGGFGGPGFGSLEDTLQTAENLNELGRLARRQGLRVYGHNHDREFTTTYAYDIDGDGDLEQTPVIEILMAETDPRYVTFEIDIHWARVGLAGGRDNPDLAEDINDPANQQQLLDFLERWSDRIELLHVKDTDEQGAFANVGEGTTDWDAVFAATPRVRHYFIEYDRTPDAYNTAEVGFAYLTCTGR